MERFDAVVENGKPAEASDLKTGERATVNYARNGKQRGRDQDRDLAQRQNGSDPQAPPNMTAEEIQAVHP